MASTIKDVAKMADVSISTVSRVINESKPVSPEARRRVLHAIEVLDYKPNEVARSLVTKKSRLIGVIVSDIGDPYVAQVLRGVEEIGRMYKYDIAIFSSYEDSEAEIKYSTLLSQKQVEGVILITQKLNERLLFKLENLRMPTVVVNRFYNVEDVPIVSINNKNAAELMTEHLIEMGHEHIAFVALQSDIDRTNDKYKIAGFKEVMQEAGLKPKVYYVEGTQEESVAEFIEDHEEIFAKHGYTAFFCSQDLIAVHMMNCFQTLGYKIPEDYSFAGFGGTKWTEIYRPRLTTVKEPYYDLGAVATRKLLKIFEKDEVEQTTLLPVQILKRDSVKDMRK